MNTKHTPGPWKTAKHGNGLLLYSDYQRHPITGATHYIASCIGTPDDARLIAKAPEMLDILTRYVGKHSRDCAINNCIRCEAGNLINEIEGE